MKHKYVTMVVTVAVPAGQTAAWARKEVRTLINEQCGFHSDPGDVKVGSIRPSQTLRT
jgi:hypothetical protein